MSAVAGERGVAVAGDVVDSVIVTGDHATVHLHVGSRSGSILERLGEATPFRALPPPVRDRPARKPDHVGREDELAELFAGERIVSVYGEPGIGKTYLLVHAGWSEQADAVRDGVIYVFARGKTRVELLQELFDALHESAEPVRRSERQLQRDLAGREILLLVDAVDLDGEELQALAGSLPEARVVVAAEERRLWEGAGVELRGVPLEQGLALVERELGRALEPGEREDAKALCRTLDGHPQRIRRAVAETVSAGRPLAEAATAATRPPRLSEDERAVLAALAAAGGERVGAGLLSRLARVSDLEAIVAELERRRLIASHSPRWSLAADVAPAAEPAQTDAVAGWVEEHRAEPATVLEEAAPLLALLRAARREGRERDTIRLGRALAPALAWGRRWDAWQEAVDAVLAAARRTGDRDAEGWALNEHGVWAFSVGDVDDAEGALVAALAVREELGDAQDLAVTRQNLQVVVGPPPPPGGDGRGGDGRGLPSWLLPAAVLVAAGVLAGSAAGWRLLSGGEAGRAGAVSLEVEGPGRVVSQPAGIDCPGDCEADFAAGTEIVLAATPAEEARFDGWEGHCADAPGTTCRLDAGEGRSVRAVFVARRAPSGARVVLEVVAQGGRVSSDPPGIACPGECSAHYDPGEVVRLEASAGDGFEFTGWDGPCAGELRPVCELTADRDLTVVARFEALPGEVELRVDPPVGGRIVSDPAGIACPEACVASFGQGTRVVLTATPDDSFQLAGWTGACEETDGATCILTLDRRRSAGARFEAIPGAVDLRVTPAEGGRVTSDPDGISCPDTCSAPFDAGAQVTLTAQPDPRFRHAGWTGACEQATGPSCSLSLREAAEVGVRFEALPARAVLNVSVRGGRLVSSPPGIDCRPRCRAQFTVGSSVTLTAVPAEPPGEGQWVFVTWRGACENESGPACTIRLDRSTTVTATIVIQGPID
jgi:hypothetical protein